MNDFIRLLEDRYASVEQQYNMVLEEQRIVHRYWAELGLNATIMEPELNMEILRLHEKLCDIASQLEDHYAYYRQQWEDAVA